MKKVLFSMLVAAMGISVASAQCTAPAPTGSPYVSPPTDSLACIEQGVAYTETITFEMPQAQPPLITGGSMRFDSIVNRPCGIDWAADQPNASYTFGQAGCFSVFGTSTDNEGQYLLDIYITVTAQTLVGPQTWSGRADQVIGDIENLVGSTGLDLEYYLRVIAPGGICPDIDTTNSNNLIAQDVCPSFTVTITGDDEACEGDSVTLYANVSLAALPVSYLWSNGSTADSVRVAAPANVTLDVIDATPDTISQSFTVSALFAPEASFTYTLSGDTVNVTSSSTNSPTAISWDFGGQGSGSANSEEFVFTAEGTYDIVLSATNACGTDDTTVTVTIQGVGIANNGSENLGLSVYPNPGKGNINARFSVANAGEAHIHVMNMQGKQVFSQSVWVNAGNNNVRLPLHKLSSGIYFISVETLGSTAIEKIIIE